MVEQALSVEVEVAHVAVERGQFLAARCRLAEDDRVNVEREVFARQLSCKQNTTHPIRRKLEGGGGNDVQGEYILVDFH